MANDFTYTWGQSAIKYSEDKSWADFDSKDIDSCIAYSFESANDYESDNKFLKKDRQVATNNKIHQHPVLTINKQIYYGDMDPTDMTHAVCAAFKDRPQECRRDAVKQYLLEYDKWDIPAYGDSITWDLLFVGVILIAINVVVLGYCKHRQSMGGDKAVVEMEVNQAVQNYFALRGDENVIAQTERSENTQSSV